jgi:hypothetical protein
VPHPRLLGGFSALIHDLTGVYEVSLFVTGGLLRCTALVTVV